MKKNFNENLKDDLQYALGFNNVNVQGIINNYDVSQINHNEFTLITSDQCITGQMNNSKALANCSYFIYSKNILTINKEITIRNNAIIIPADTPFELKWCSNRKSISFIIPNNEILNISKIQMIPMSNLKFGDLVNQFLSLAYSFYGNDMANIYDVVINLLKKEVGSEQKELFIEIVEYIDANFHEPNLSLQDLCEHFHISKRTIQSIFSKNGYTFKQLLIKKRNFGIQNGIKTSKNPNIKKIVYNNGYHNYSSALNNFKNQFNLTFSEYKNSVSKDN
ncbi:AraC family transcriptional regulator [Aliivibrio fischeri]|uniref:AraC family transcriptional regulator n=1 Tax=Aliivibrio fischeri TaxID=668 RepID=UPI00080EE663|nr:AraC family transcriptional regulator [Aliivibrio fischeri]OCH43064.1 hypothetical protein A6D99_00340 [Aliivibrio fischeri]